MHMADALLSPAVGATLWAAAAGSLAWSARVVRREQDDRQVPLMGVLGAFTFAAQLVNFTIPGTGSSGHLGGGLLLAVLLGPWAALPVMAAWLTVQALLFADGGLLALGCNIVNLGVLPCLVAYPLVFQPLAGRDPRAARRGAATVLAAVCSVELGALGVTAETSLSGISALPLGTFALLLLPIHLVIGVVEGLVTAALLSFLHRAEPGLLRVQGRGAAAGPRWPRRLLAGGALAALLTAGVLSWFASSHPDGLEWAIVRVTGATGVATPAGGLHAVLGRLQHATALLPGYGLEPSGKGASESAAGPEQEPAPGTAWPAVDRGTSLAGLVGSLVTLALAALLGLLLRRRAVRRRGVVSDTHPSVPDAWLGYLQQHVPFFAGFPPAERELFLRKLVLFVGEKAFFAAGGLELTDEVRVVIAAAAVRLILHLDFSCYDRLTEIVVYPHEAYVHPTAGVRLGEAHRWGTVVLSWPAVQRGLHDRADGMETAAHEFAHVLDLTNGAFDGTPRLRRRAQRKAWAEVMNAHFARLRAGDPRELSLLRAYGGKNEAEFFAVATESFLEKPGALRAGAPDLYGLLRGYYGFDPQLEPPELIPRSSPPGRSRPG